MSDPHGRFGKVECVFQEEAHKAIATKGTILEWAGQSTVYYTVKSENGDYIFLYKCVPLCSFPLPAPEETLPLSL